MARSSSAQSRRPVAAAKPDPKRVVVSVSIEEDVLRQFDVAARLESRTRSSQIAFLMRRWLEERR